MNPQQLLNEVKRTIQEVLDVVAETPSAEIVHYTCECNVTAQCLFLTKKVEVGEASLPAVFADAELVRLRNALSALNFDIVKVHESTAYLGWAKEAPPPPPPRRRTSRWD